MQLISADEDRAELQRKIVSLQTETSKLAQSRKDIQAAHERIHKHFQNKMTDLQDTNKILVEINKNLEAQNQDRQVSTDVSQHLSECTSSDCIDKSMNSFRSQLDSFEESANGLIQSDDLKKKIHVQEEKYVTGS